MGRGKFKGKPTGRRHFSTREEIEGKVAGRRHFSTREEIAVAGSSTRPHTFKQEEAEADEQKEESEEESEEETGKRKGPQGLIQIENPNILKPKNVKARDINIERTTELSRRERKEIEKHEAHERFMRLQEQGKTEQARKDLERLALIRKQRADAAGKREEEKAAKEQKKTEARK